jgi:hypothetical protein
MIREGHFYMDWEDKSPESYVKYRELVGYAFAALRSPDVILVNAQSVWDDLVPPVEARDQAAWDRVANYPEIPSPKPPFKNMWMEGIYADTGQRFGVLTARKDLHGDLEEILAALDLEDSLSKLIRSDNPATLVNGTIFHQFEGAACYTGTIEYWLDADGKFLSSFRQYPELPGFDEEDVRQQKLNLKLRQGWALHTFARLNCHNVKLLPMKAGAPSTKQSKKHRKPLTVWHEIVVEKVVERRPQSERASGEKQDLRFHQVRGHYADYTKGAGLFGKYKVRLWVDEHARGNREVGEVVASYTVS